MSSTLRTDSLVFCLHDLPGHGMDIIIVFNATRSKFQLKDRVPIVVVEFLIVKYRICCIDVGLGQGNFLCLFQSDVGGRLAVFGISRVIIILVDGHDTGGKAQAFYGFLRAGAHIR